MFGRTKTATPLGYKVTSAGESHRCRLPAAQRFARGTSIRCEACGRTAEVVYNGMIGNYWTGPMENNK